MPGAQGHCVFLPQGWQRATLGLHSPLTAPHQDRGSAHTSPPCLMGDHAGDRPITAQHSLAPPNPAPRSANHTISCGPQPWR